MMVKNLNKFKDLLVYTIENSQDKNGVYETKLWKLLYFCDADFFEKHERTITGADYIKNHFGPTPEIATIKEAVAALKLKGVVIRKNIKNRIGSNSYVYVRGDSPYSFDALSGEELEDARKTLKKYGFLSVAQLTKLSHSYSPFLAAEPKKTIEFRNVLYRQDDIEIDTSEPINGREARQLISDDSMAKLLEYATEKA